MKRVTRAIAPLEAEVIRAVLLRAPEISPDAKLLDGLASLEVVGCCDCGCPSLYFRGFEERGAIIGDGIGTMPNGEDVGVVVWGAPDRISELEIYEMRHPATNLPILASIRSWGARRE